MSGFSAGGGPVFMASANADAVLALIKVLADPKLYQERLGELTTAEEMAREAGHNAAVAAAECAQRLQEMNAAKVQLDADRAAHAKASSNMDARAGALQEDISRREVVLQDATAELDGERELFERTSVARMTDMDQRQQWITHKETELREREKTLTLREQSVAAKLAKIREIDQAG